MLLAVISLAVPIIVVSFMEPGSAWSSGRRRYDTYVLSVLTANRVPWTLRLPALESSAVANLRTINTAEVTCQLSNGDYGTIEQLSTSGLVDSRFTSVVGGYHFRVTVRGTDYTATADALKEPHTMKNMLIKWWTNAPEPGRFDYYSGPDGVVRYGTTAPVGQVGQAVQ